MDLYEGYYLFRSIIYFLCMLQIHEEKRTFDRLTYCADQEGLERDNKPKLCPPLCI